MTIDDFRFEYRWLSNFHISPVEYEGIIYPSSEHAYHAAKNNDPDWKVICSTESRPSFIKKLGSKVELRPDWNSIRVSVMRTILRSKFQDPELRKKLIDTGESELIEGNSWGDIFWGVDSRTGGGLNHMGKLLMEIRSEITGGPLMKFSQDTHEVTNDDNDDNE